MASFKVLFWDGIPTQVKAKEPGARTVSVQLDNWFIEHIDRLAMHRGQFGGDEYLAQFKWSKAAERPGDPKTVADAVARELEAAWRPLRERWEAGQDDILEERPE